MHQFNDNATPSRTWELRVSIAEVFEVRDALKGPDGKPLVDLGRLLDDFNNFAALTADSGLFAEVLYVLCKTQIEKLGMSKLDFWRGLLGDALHDAGKALYGELVNFCRNPKARPALRAVMEKAEQIAAKLIEKGQSMLAEIDPATEAANVIGSLKSSTTSPVS